MKILVVQESDWIEKGPHQSHHLMERLSRRGHEMRVIDYEILWRMHNHDGLISRREIFRDVHKAIDDGRVTVIRPPIIRLPVLDYVSLLFTHGYEIKRQIEEFKPDAIVGFGILNANLSIRFAKKNGIPFIYYIIDELHRLVPQRYFQGIARRIESANMRGADRVLSINECLRDYTVEMGASPEKTQVIRAGVDLKRFDSACGGIIRERYGLKERDVVLFFMGWLYEFSGLREVAYELARADNEGLKLLVLGEGDLWDELHKVKREYRLDDRIIMVDWCPYSEVPAYIAASDICLLPAYKNEIMMNIVPIKMYEYMAMGKPVIATRLPGVMKEFGTDNGVIYIDKPEDALHKALELRDSNIIESEGKKARKFVERNDWERVTDEFERVLEEAALAGV